MNANEALVLTLESSYGKVAEIRQVLDEEISAAASKGKRTCCYFGMSVHPKEIENALIASLRSDGFGVRYVADPDPGHPCSRSYHEITW